MRGRGLCERCIEVRCWHGNLKSETYNSVQEVASARFNLKWRVFGWRVLGTVRWRTCV